MAPLPKPPRTPMTPPVKYDKLPSDPIRRFLQISGYRYTYGYLPSTAKLEPEDKVRTALVNRTKNLAHILFGNGYWHCLLKMGIPQRVLGYIYDQKANPKRAPQACRELNLYLITHIAGIREHLIELERECWVNLQLSHDPRIDYISQPYQKRNDTRAKVVQRQLDLVKRPGMLTHILPQRLVSLGDEIHPDDELSKPLIPFKRYKKHNSVKRPATPEVLARLERMRQKSSLSKRLRKAKDGQ